MPGGNEVVITADMIPSVVVPPVISGVPVYLQIKGCIGMISRTLMPPVNSDGTLGKVRTVTILDAAESMQAEWATQQASQFCPDPTTIPVPDQTPQIGCRNCPPEPCTPPDNLAFTEPICATEPIAVTDANGNTIVVLAADIPCVMVPPVTPGVALVLELAGCISMITRTLLPPVNPDGTLGTVSQADINAAVASMQAEWATQLTSPDCPPAPPPPPPEESETVFNDEQCVTVQCPAGFITEPGPQTACVAAGSMFEVVFNPTPATVATARANLNVLAHNQAAQQAQLGITNCTTVPGATCFYDFLQWTQNAGYLAGFGGQGFQWFGTDPSWPGGKGVLTTATPLINCLFAANCASEWNNRIHRNWWNTTLHNCDSVNRRVNIRADLSWNMQVYDTNSSDLVRVFWQTGGFNSIIAWVGAFPTIGFPNGVASKTTGPFIIAPGADLVINIRLEVTPCQASYKTPCICGAPPPNQCNCQLLKSAAVCTFYLIDV